MLVTVFTPTYNRAYILRKLYESLQEQTDKDFEWVVVDDGSTDDTQELIAGFKAENRIPITAVKTPNGGKHRAINRGVGLAKGELFFIVDSDDYLTADAIGQIRRNWEDERDRSNLGGLCLRKINYSDNRPVGGDTDIERGIYSSPEIAYKLGVSGDKAEVFRTCVMKEFPFPSFEHENFVPESLVWNRIADKYKLLFVNTGIYMCDYLPDGLSKNFSRNLKRNPRGFALFYREEWKRRGLPLKIRIKSLVRWMQCRIYRWTKR